MSIFKNSAKAQNIKPENNKENNQPLSENNLNGGKDFKNPPGSTQGQTPGGN